MFHGPVSLISTHNRSTRHRFGPAQLDIGSGLLDSISILARSTRHRPGPRRLDIGPSLLDPTLARACLVHQRSGIARLDIGAGPLGWTSARPDPIFWYRPGPGRFDIELERLSSTLVQAWTA